MSRSSEGASPETTLAAVAERDRMRDAERGHALIDYILEEMSGDAVLGLRAACIGSPDTPALTEKDEPPPFWSIKARQLDLLSFLLGRLIAELEKGDLYPLWTTGGPDFDREVARAVWQLGGANIAPEVLTRIPTQAMAVAKVVHRFVDIARKAQNQEGGYHPPYPGALISGGHDALKLLRAGKVTWVAFVRPLLDDETFDGIDPDKFLDLAFEAFSLHQDPNFYFRFKDADGWTAYNARFGFGTFREAIVAALERAARRTGMYAVLGTQPKNTLKGVLQALEKATGNVLPEKARAQLERMLAGLAPVWPLGTLGTRFETDMGRFALGGLIDLGVAMFPDREGMPTFTEDVPYRGTTLFDAIDVELKAFVSSHGVDPNEETLEFASAITKFGDAFNGALADRFVALDNPPGRMAELLRQFLKLNVMHWWTEISRKATFASLGDFVSVLLSNEYSQLAPAFAATLSRFGIDSAIWETVRADIGYGENRRPSEALAAAARKRLDAWVWDRLALVALGADESGDFKYPQVATNFAAESDLLRFLTQFRRLRAPFLPKLGGPAALRDADRAMAAAMAAGDGLPAFVNLFIWTVLLARLARFAFNLTEAIEPPSGAIAVNLADGGTYPRDSNEDWPWFDSAMVGGSLGFFADLLFGDTTGLKSLPLSAFATVSHPAIESALEIWRAARDADDVRADLAEWAENDGDAGALDTLQVTRQVLNYALLHQLQDMMSPGYLQRTVKDMQQRTRNAYWLFPRSDDSSDDAV
jgi:hypothetical protein